MAGVRAGIIAILVCLAPVAAGSRAVAVAEGLREVFVFHGADPLERIEVEQRWPRRAGADAEVGTATLLFADGTELPLRYSRSRAGAYRFRSIRRLLEQAGEAAPVVDLFVVAGPGPGPARRLRLLVRFPDGTVLLREDPTTVTMTLRPGPSPWLVTGGPDGGQPEAEFSSWPAVAARPDGSVAVAVTYWRRPTLFGAVPFRTRLEDRARRDPLRWENATRHENVCLADFSPEGALRRLAAIGGVFVERPQIAALADGSSVVAVGVMGRVSVGSADGDEVHGGWPDAYGLLVARYLADGRLAFARVGRFLEPYYYQRPRVHGVLGLPNGRCVVVAGGGSIEFGVSAGTPGQAWVTEYSFALCFAGNGEILGESYAPMYPFGSIAPSSADPEAFYLTMYGNLPFASVRRIRAPDVVEWTASFWSSGTIWVQALAPLSEDRVAALLTEQASPSVEEFTQRLVILGSDGAVLADSPLAPGTGVALGLYPHPDGNLLTLDTTGDDWSERWTPKPRNLLLRRRDETGLILSGVTLVDQCVFPEKPAVASSPGFLAIATYLPDRAMLYPEDGEVRTRCFSVGERDLLLFRAEWP